MYTGWCIRRNRSNCISSWKPASRCRCVRDVRLKAFQGRYRRAVHDQQAQSVASNREIRWDKSVTRDAEHIHRKNGLCHVVLYLGNVYCQTDRFSWSGTRCLGCRFAYALARFTQAGRGHTHGNRLAHQFDEHHDPSLAVRHLIDAFNA